MKQIEQADIDELLAQEKIAKDQGICPVCGEIVDQSLFKDEISREEFKITGLCNSCQMEMIEEEDEEDPFEVE